MRSSVKMYCYFASFFVCFHGGFVVSKSIFKFRCGGADILEIAFLAMNQINHIRRTTREFLANKIRFTSLCSRKSLRVVKEVLTKIASGFITGDTSRWWNCNWLSEPSLHLEGAKISLRFLDLRNDEMIEFGGKNSLRNQKSKGKLLDFKTQPCY